MPKTKLYDWRLNADLKRRLENAARAEKISVSSLLDRIARDWLGKQRPEENDEALQRRLHAEAEEWIGSISSGDPYGSEQVKERVRARLMEKRRRWQRDAPAGPARKGARARSC